MGQDVNPRIGVIADTLLQGNQLANAAKALGYDVVLSAQAGTFDREKWVGKGMVECWLVDLGDQEKWADLLDVMLDQTDAPVIFGDGLAPAKTHEEYPRWERRLFQTLIKSVGRPVLAKVTLAVPEKPVAVPKAPVIVPPEFKLASQSETTPQRIWVLGASAGGPVAVKAFLDSLPAEIPVAFVLAQHIDPNPKMLETLANSLVRHNAFRIRIGRAGEPLRYGEIVVAPCDAEITFDEKACVLSTGRPWEGPYSPSIDQVINNVANRFGKQTGAILFSGMGNDGSIAAPQMAAKGGQVWAQSAETCAVSSQADSVRDTGCVSYSGSPEFLAKQLIEFVRQQLKGKPAAPAAEKAAAS